MYWGADQALFFLVTWVIGGALFVVSVMVTRNTSASTRIGLCSLVLALTLTPSIIFTTGIAIAPAVFILLWAPFLPHLPDRFTYAAMLGALPIATVWLLIAGAWALVRKIKKNDR